MIATSTAVEFLTYKEKLVRPEVSRGSWLEHRVNQTLIQWRYLTEINFLWVQGIRRRLRFRNSFGSHFFGKRAVPSDLGAASSWSRRTFFRSARNWCSWCELGRIKKTAIGPLPPTMRGFLCFFSLSMITKSILLVESNQLSNSRLMGTWPVLEIDRRTLILDTDISSAPLAMGAWEKVELCTPRRFQARCNRSTSGWDLGGSGSWPLSFYNNRGLIWAQYFTWYNNWASGECWRTLGALETMITSTFLGLDLRSNADCFETMRAGEALYGGEDTVLASWHFTVSTEVKVAQWWQLGAWTRIKNSIL